MLWRMQADVDVDELSRQVDLDKIGWTEFATAGTIIIVTFVVARVVRSLLARALKRGQADDFISELIGRVASYLLLVFGLIYALEALGIAIGPALGALGIVGIALAFALQDLLENFVAGVLLQLRRPFRPGDEVQSVDHEGAIVRIDSRAVVIHTPDGEIVRIPSAAVIKHPIINLTARKARRTTVEVGVAYGSSLAETTRLLSDAVAGVPGVYASPAPQVYSTGFGESSIDFAVRYWHEPTIASMWRVRHEVVLCIEQTLADAGIVIPFPQRVVHVVGDRSPGAESSDADRVTDEE
ncbi:MAG: mechanosensitive ion channel family protein [Acidimicrobiales bacterium]